MVYIFLCFILFNLIAWFAPKNLSKIEIYATSFFSFTYGLTTDVVFDLHYHMYGYFSSGFQWMGLVAIIMYFPSISFLFLNFFPFHKGLKLNILYILSWIIFSIAFEWITLQTEFFYYNGWTLWYSALAYPFIFLVLIGNLKIVRKLIEER